MSLDEEDGQPGRSGLEGVLRKSKAGKDGSIKAESEYINEVLPISVPDEVREMSPQALVTGLFMWRLFLIGPFGRVFTLVHIRVDSQR